MSTAQPTGSEDELARLYRATIMQHAQEPTGRGKVIRETHRNEQFNPMCGDRIILFLQVEDEVVSDAAFEGEACAICTASASLLCEHSTGRAVEDIKKTHRWLEAALHGKAAATDYESLAPLLGVRSYPSRIRCALLPWDALAAALIVGACLARDC